MKKLNILLVVFVSVLSMELFSQQQSANHQLDSLVIRSFSAEAGQSIALAGIKGEVGDGLVYKCSKDRWDWTVTNGGKPLDPNVEDVQAVAAINDSVFLAGTWKNGLFRTEDAGNTWKKLTNFPSKDIRSIRVVDHGYKRIYAATTSAGIQASLDLGKTWKTVAPDSMDRILASWSIEADPVTDGVIYALTFENGIQCSQDFGKTWVKSLQIEGIMFYDIAFSRMYPKHLYAVGSNDSIGAMYGSTDGGNNWQKVLGLPDALYSQVAFAGPQESTILLGSWDKGAFQTKNHSWVTIPEVGYENVSGIYGNATQMVFATWGDGFYQLGDSGSRRDLTGLGPKLLTDSILLRAYVSLYSQREVVLSRRVKRNERQVVVKGYTQEVIGMTSQSDQPQPIYGRKKKFKRIESNVTDKLIRKKFGI